MATVTGGVGAEDRASPSTGARGSRLWRAAFRALFAVSPPLIPRTVRRFAEFGIVQEIIVVGRRSGVPRSVFVCVYDLGGRLYVGHPIGETAQWTRNVDAAGTAILVRRDGSRTAMRAVRLDAGPERDALVEAMPGQQVGPFAALYRGARSHIGAAGVYYRLEPEAETAG